MTPAVRRLAICLSSTVVLGASFAVLAPAASADTCSFDAGTKTLTANVVSGDGVSMGPTGISVGGCQENADQVDTVLAQVCRGTAVVAVLRSGVATPDGLLPRHSGLTGKQHRLAGNARDIRTLAADEPFLDDQDPTAVGDALGDVLTGRPTAEHDNVVRTLGRHDVQPARCGMIAR